MSEFGADHAQISVEFVRHSRAYLSNGELLQASEKGWGAAAHAAKLFANARALEYTRHEHFRDVISELQIETGNPGIFRWQQSANLLHRNFYDDAMTAPQIADHLDNVASLVNLIRQAVGLSSIYD